MMRVDLVGWSLLFIALATGYFVLIKAGKAENKNLKLVGYIIGIIVMVGCLLLALSDVSLRLRPRKGVAAPKRTAGMPTTRPIATPKANIAVPKLPKSVTETAPVVVPNIPVPPAESKAQ